MKKLTIIGWIITSVLFLSACSRQEVEQSQGQLPEEKTLISEQEEPIEKPEIKAPVIKGIETSINKEEQEATPNIPVTPPATSTTPVTTAPKTESCTSLDCLAELAKTCEKGQVAYHYSQPAPFFSDFTQTGSTQYTIEGKDENGQCKLIIKINESVISISEEKRALGKEIGFTDMEGNNTPITDEMLDEGIRKMNESLAPMIGSITTCTGTGENISTYLLNIKTGQREESSCKINFGEGNSVCTFEPGLTCLM